MLSRGAGVQIMSADELVDVVVKLVQDPVLRDQYGVQGKQFVEENRGALKKIEQLVKGCLEPV